MSFKYVVFKMQCNIISLWYFTLGQKKKIIFTNRIILYTPKKNIQFTDGSLNTCLHIKNNNTSYW